MDNNRYFQYIRKCCTKRQQIEIHQILSKLRKKFQIGVEKANIIISDLKIAKLIEIDGEIIKINILANPIRRNIYDLITKYPGIFVNHIRRMVGIGPNHVLYHLSELEALKLITIHTFGNLKAFSLPHISEDQVKIGIILLKKNIQEIIHLLLNSSSDNTENHMVQKTDIPRSTVLYTLNKLIGEKFVQKSKIGNNNCYKINPKYEISIQNAMNQLQSIKI